jgi:hypothetical protein
MQALQHGEMVCPLSAKLSFEFFGKDTFLYQELYHSIGHR